MGIFIVTVLSLVAGLVLSLTNHYLNNKEDNIKEVEEMLPGYNCNNCGFGNCRNYAENLYDDITLDKCKFLKENKKKEIIDYINNQKEEL